MVAICEKLRVLTVCFHELEESEAAVLKARIQGARIEDEIRAAQPRSRLLFAEPVLEPTDWQGWLRRTIQGGIVRDCLETALCIVWLGTIFSILWVGASYLVQAIDEAA